MRLHHLTMTAVGPYPGTEVIDFDRFTSSGRFLLTGPTGAGKTTIIDAIVFALYGDVAGDKDSSKDRIRSRLAGPGTETVVELVFSTSAGTYRVRRTPAYERLKRRGSGTTTQKASLKVWRLSDPAGRPSEDAALRPDEAGPELTRAIGLSREQFTQTIVLPQGKFATFLRASSDERHQLLRDVFGTRVYDELQEELRRRALAARNATEEARRHLQAAAQAFAQAAFGETPSGTQAGGQAPPDPPDVAEPEALLPTPRDLLLHAAEATAPDPQTVATVIATATQERADRLQAAHAAVQAAQQERDKAREDLDQAQALAGLLAQRRALLEAQKQLDDEADQARLTAQALDLARRAGSVAGMADRALKDLEEATQALEHERGSWEEAGWPQTPLEPALTEIKQDLTRLSSWNEVSGAPQPGQVPGLPATTAALKELETRSRQCREQAAALAEAESLEAGIPARVGLADSRRQEEARIAEQADAARKELNALPERATSLRQRLEAAHRAQERVSDLRSAHEAAQRRAQAAAKAQSVRAQREQARDAVERARTQASKAEDHAHALRTAWINATSATLVGELRPGSPCPVCGSCQHPHPASALADPVSRDDLETADQVAGLARTRLEAASTHLAAVEAELAQALASAEGRSPEHAADELEESRSRLSQAAEEAQERPGLQQELDTLSARESELRQRLGEHQEAAAALAATLVSQEQALAHDRAQVAAARGDCASVAQRRSGLSQQAEQDEDSLTRLRGLLALVSAARLSQQDLAEQMDQAGFASRDALSGARRSEAEVQEMASLVRSRDAEAARVRAGLSRPEIAALTGAEEPGLQAAGLVLDQAEDQWRLAVSQRAQAQAEADALQAQAGRLSQAVTDLVTVIGDNAPLLHVAALAAGENRESTPLATWVLTERFKEVLDFANHRLEAMSAGRYELIQVDDEKHSARKRGLGMGVLDRLGGDRTRDPRTLSGGETFYVSLALALALADVVATESGGVLMETLFVDEGFGSLDPQTLQDVLAELGRLQQGGRTVGIVSHVEELRRQIPDQVKVTSTPEGSRLTVVAS
ncbi:AAA family ATPase [Actinomyces faecalis]|uniref:AAA family ATPase n=1 Tax=Actinomyces faecalis TaxID=2722820 RepID=UPI001556D102|nr:SMC family ATPase [Actinomyces faecalis]